MATTHPSRFGIHGDLATAFRNAGWIEGDSVDPEAARLLEALRSGPEPEAAIERLANVLAAAPGLAAQTLESSDSGRAVIAVCGASRRMSRWLQDHPEWLDEAVRTAPPPWLLPPGSFDERARALRRFVQRRLLRTAVRDLLGLADMPAVGRELSDIADAAAAAALDTAHAATRERPEFSDLGTVPFTVIAMGKWGGRELNYASDIDVLFVYDVADGIDPEAAGRYSRIVAETFLQALGGVTPEGIAFRVDADLRPEGTAGPLARSLDAYRAYYDRWAETWEFQALIKARPAAGDDALGVAFADLIEPYVYPDVLTPDAVRQIRTMKARIERERIPADEDPAFHMKLGHGGLNDVEFTVQLLQLRHGGAVAELRRTGTLDAIDALEAATVLSPQEAGVLRSAYAFCGRVRNRLFLQAGRVRDSLPTDPGEATRLALSLGYDLHPSTALREEYRRHTRRARRIVSARFYEAPASP